MIKEVVSVGLPIDERIIIKKNTIEPDNIMGNEKRICIVTGIHGDELEGQYVCYELIKRINENKSKLKGIVDIYPAINPLGIDSISRELPMLELDMNRIFPGSEGGTMEEFLANRIICDIEGADICIDVHSSNIYLKEIPQVRISEENATELMDYAKKLNVDFIWVHEAETVLRSTLYHSLNSRGVKTLVVEMGVGMRITKEYCNNLVDGIFALMKSEGIWEGESIIPKEPVISSDGEVALINAQCSGVFIPCVKHWKDVKKGEHIGDIISPIEGKVIDEVISPCSGMLFTLREYPIVYEGSLIGRVLGGEQ
ncbi:succinylglutamate desuccinylase/aspartoacylase family protein [Clostridium sp. MSJ-8]|uniref:M14 family metallopeptidase n=1 Tax=Clostridium sp. MSJ-8 TaxID=2841510 RepID=UPI001C0F312B|nr:M14 family metallopeptidase [Clostridium sp. MSJ-8]MBU5488212.1 succinylglutamate desuccinylase/aspartoacylase family protein [Clostridium sp. MSJ-8]